MPTPRRRILLFGSTEKQYLLYDDFSDTLAAGSVNGTAAKIGGLRTVVDTESKLSIAGGQLSFAGGKAAPLTGDPGVFYPALSMVTGRLWLCTETITATNTYLGRHGWHTSNTGSPTDAFRLDGTSAIIVLTNNVSSPVLGRYAAATYKFAIVRGVTNFYFFIQGGAFAAWTYLGAFTATVATNMYPAIANYNAVCTADNILVPAQLWLPAPLASDSFTRADGALGLTDGLGHAEANGGAGLTWAGATWAISSNAAVNTPTVNATLNSGNLVVGSWYKIVATEADHFYTGCAANDVFVATATTALDANNTVKLLTLSELFATLPALSTADTLPEAAITITGNVSGGIVCNLDSAASPANFIIAYYNKQSGKACLDEYVAGARTSKIEATTTYAAGARLNLVRSGTEARLFYNNAAVGTVQTMTANTNKIAGLFSTDSGVSLDNAVVWARGTSNEYSYLDNL